MNKIARLLQPADAKLLMPVGALRLGAYTYNPKVDVTPYELARLLELFTFAFHPTVPRTYDFEDFVTKHNLTRHFDKKESS